MSPKLIAIAAMDENRVIGIDNRIPWHVPQDLKRFSSLTRGHTVLMGRATWDSLTPKFQPLAGRFNIVLTSSPDRIQKHPSVKVYTDLDTCIREVKSGVLKLNSDILWIMGGAKIYAETEKIWDELYLTVVHSKFSGDTFFPKFEDDFELQSEEKHEGFSFLNYKRR